jgi:hypothetical protein
VRATTFLGAFLLHELAGLRFDATVRATTFLSAFLPDPVAR